MPRIGELLIASGLLDADELEQALRAQVVWGGRLGTNLIELGFTDLDELSRALGKQHGLPAALARHFEKADPALQATLGVELADRHSCVPLLRLADGKIALAAIDPIDDEGLGELAAALGVAVENLVLSVAAEQRMRYQLERVYGIARSARYLRSRGGTIPPFPQFGDFETEPDSEVEIPIDWDESAPEPEPEAAPVPERAVDHIAIPRADTDALAAAIETAAAASAAPEGVPAGRDRRAYVKTLADGGDGSEAADPAPARPARTSTRKREPSKPKKALGRIAIRKVAVVPGNGGPAVVAPGESEFEPREVDTLTEAARAIRRSPDRDRVAELVIDALARFTPGAEAAMLFVIRGTSATGWKHFSRAGAEQPELAVPMDEPGLVPRAATGATVRARASELGPIDARLLKKLTVQGTAELAVVPIAIAGKVMCVLVVAISPESGLGTIETIATSAGTAFARLMRDAGR